MDLPSRSPLARSLRGRAEMNMAGWLDLLEALKQ